MSQTISQLSGQPDKAGKLYPLSRTQLGILSESLSAAGTTKYHIPRLYQLDDRVDIPRLQNAVHRAISAHPCLSMTLVYDENGEPMARRSDGNIIEAELLDHLPGTDALIVPFDLSGKLCRAAVIDSPEGKYLFLDMHHIICDGTSVRILLEDINTAYEGGEIIRESFSGFEFALDEKKRRESDQFASAREWYESVCKGRDSQTLPTASATPDSREKASSARYVSPCSAGRVQEWCAGSGVKPGAFFTAAFGIALQAYTGSESAVFAAIYHGRKDPRISRGVSMFVKTLPVILEPAPGQSIRNTVEATGRWLSDAAANDLFSFAEIREAWGIGSDVLFAYQGKTAGTISIAGHPAKAVDLPQSRTPSPFSVELQITDDQIIYQAEWDPARYSSYTMNGFVRMLDRIVLQMTEKETVGEISLIGEEEVQAILSLHDTDVAVAERPAYRLLQDSAEKVPEKTALVAADRTLTYRELNAEANAVGRILREHGAKPETIVAVMADRDSYAYVMREGVLKSGGAFLPVDPEYPEE
ncbi:MAG: AMP-binding protein, partial [Clostridia bacterium]|nr:AMP-binding protein [Clostridia bacterium]